MTRRYAVACLSVLAIDIPGFGPLRLRHLVLDYNGTLALDGKLLPGVKRHLNEISRRLEVHVLTADTFGLARRALEGTPCRLTILAPGRQDRAKLAYLTRLGASRSACIGNGRNDRLMLGAAALGIAVLQAEGAAAETVSAADLVVPDIVRALQLFGHPLRLRASLRT